MLIKKIQFFIIICLLLISQPSIADQYISISKQDCDNSLSVSQQRKNSIHLDCKSYYQTTDHTCGPAAVMTLMRYYKRLAPSEMNQRTELRIAMEMGATEQGTSLSQVANWLSGHGFRVDSGRRVTSDIIIDNLKRGIPTIVGANKHWVVAKGLRQSGNRDQDEILFSDSCCGTSTLTRADIDSMWGESQINGSHCRENQGQYIVATPN